MVIGVIPSAPRYVPLFFVAHRVQNSHCSLICIECTRYASIIRPCVRRPFLFFLGIGHISFECVVLYVTAAISRRKTPPYHTNPEISSLVCFCFSHQTAVPGVPTFRHQAPARTLYVFHLRTQRIPTQPVSVLDNLIVILFAQTDVYVYVSSPLVADCCMPGVSYYTNMRQEGAHQYNTLLPLVNGAELKSALGRSRRRLTWRPDPVWYHVGHTILQLLLYIQPY